MLADPRRSDICGCRKQRSHVDHRPVPWNSGRNHVCSDDKHSPVCLVVLQEETEQAWHDALRMLLAGVCSLALYGFGECPTDIDARHWIVP